MAEDATTKLDRDLTAAKARVRAKREKSSASGEGPPNGSAKEEPEPSSSKRTGKRLSQEARAERDQQAMEERQKAKTQKAQEREARRQEKQSQKQTPHLSKVKKAAGQLPDLSDKAGTFYEKLVKDLTAAELSALGQHLQHHYRHHITEAASKRTLQVGQRVRMLGGPSKVVGKVGTVVDLHRIRCYVKVDGYPNTVYVFTSETENVDEKDAAAAKTAE